MIRLSSEQFLLRQPNFPETTDTDQYYFDLANALLADYEEAAIFADLHPEVAKRAALCTIGYFQDIISDAGLWRGFISQCKRLYSQPVPFHMADDDYIDSELNEADVQFMVWYAIAMLDETHRLISPRDERVLALGSLWYRRLDSCYDSAPEPEAFNLTFELSVYDPEDATHIARLSQWLFMHSWLITPSFAMTLAELAAQAQVAEEGGDERMQKLMEEAMAQYPVGPLALFMKEWIYLILHDKMPPRKRVRDDKEAAPHKYFKAVTRFTKGSDMVYIPDYKALNKFFIDVLGWDEEEDHLPQMKEGENFVVMVHRTRGMLLARDVAQCIADPANPLYDKKRAADEAINLLTRRGLCPPDLLQRVLENGWLPDAAFPGEPADGFAVTWADFIARCYLQLFYRGD